MSATQTVIQQSFKYPIVLSSANMTSKCSKAELKELDEAEMDVAHELERILRFDVLDSIFYDWSVKCTHDPTAFLARKHYVTYKHDEIPYRSSISNFTDANGMWTKIKLASNNFQYYPLRNAQIVTLSDLNGNWLRVNTHYLNSLPRIAEYARKWCGNETIACLYNRERELTLVKCKGRINLMILFQNLEPYTEADNACDN